MYAGFAVLIGAFQPILSKHRCVRRGMQLSKILQFSNQNSKSFEIAAAVVLVVSTSGCFNKLSIALPKSPEVAKKPAAPGSPPLPSAPFSAKYVLSAKRETFLKARAIDSGKLADAEKCPINEGSQIALASPPEMNAGQHWKISLQLNLPGCSLVTGYLFADHWRKVETTPEMPDDPCGLPSDLDYDTARKLAEEAQRLQIGRFTGRCYEYTGMAIENVGLMPKGPQAWREAGVPVISAADFVEVEKSSVASKFTRLNLRSWACLPLGAIVVWDRGVCGFNATHGHIEVVVNRRPAYPSETRLCSDGCQSLQTRCSLGSGVTIFMPRK